jgi:hypothetical protein
MEAKELKDIFKEAVRKSPNIDEIPKTLYITIRKTPLDDTTKLKLINLLRAWNLFIQNQPASTDPFEIRSYIQQFAKDQFGKHQRMLPLQSVPMSEIFYEGKSFKSYLAKATDTAILHDPNMAIFGGIARTALKAYFSIAAKSEFPITDVDMIAKVTPNLKETVAKYRGDLMGTKIVTGDMFHEIQNIISNGVDCTMNQVAIYQNRLYYTEDASNNLRKGSITMVLKNDPLFEPEVIELPNKSLYFTKIGFYRALSYLLRGKGAYVVISQENIDAERLRLGKYWLILLVVKLMKIKRPRWRNIAIINWFLVAKQFGSTDTENPREFLEELLQAEPDMIHLFRKKTPAEYTTNQVQQLTTKLVERAIDSLFEKDMSIYPTSYTPVKVFNPTKQILYDMKPFWELVEELRSW